jgi:hypothetical protein
MQTFGSDRVRELENVRVILMSRYAKNGWLPRVQKTLTSPEHPGTAIFWGDAIYEIVAADVQPQGGVRYVLEPWREEHAIRVSDRYDEESEARRLADHQARIRREQKRKATTLIAFLAGHLPAIVQEQMASDLGMLAHRMTLLSVLSEFLILAALVLGIVHQLMQGNPLHPWHVIVVGFLMAEISVRFLVAWSQNRPLGSVAGVLVYSIAYAAGWRRGMVSPMKEAKGYGIYTRVEEADTKLRDAFHLREPLVTLLTPAEQARFAERFDYDYRRHSYKIAWMFLLFSLAGVYTSLKNGSIVSFLCAGLLAVEQLMRLSAFKRGPAGSVLGVLARPLVKGLGVG